MSDTLQQAPKLGPQGLDPQNLSALEQPPSAQPGANGFVGGLLARLKREAHDGEPGGDNRGTLGPGDRSQGLLNALSIGLGVTAILSGILTYSVLTRAAPFSPEPGTVTSLLWINFTIAAALIALIASQIGKLIIARRRGYAGAKLHARVVSLFALIAVAPSVLVAVFSSLVLDLGVDAWFSEKVNSAIANSRKVAEGYVREHSRNVIVDITLMANDLNKVAPQAQQDRAGFNDFVTQQALLRQLSAAFVLDAEGRPYAAVNIGQLPNINLPAPGDLAKAEDGQVHLLSDTGEGQIRALYRLRAYKDAYLYIIRPVSSSVLEYHQQSVAAAQQYESIAASRGDIRFTFLALFLLVALLTLLAAIWIGLWLANRMMAPISRLMVASQKVAGGDLGARIEVGRTQDELAALGAQFNHMTADLQRQRDELVDANRHNQERWRFTEAVLAGVSAGVIGLDHLGRLTLINRTAAQMLHLDRERDLCKPLSDLVPALQPLLTEALTVTTKREAPVLMRQVDLNRDDRTLNLNVRVTREESEDDLRGYVVTIDDITDLVSAERTAAWSDVARRIAHEIKNPLTPIQLSAERLRRKYLKEVTSDPEVFEQCTETIIRQVNDIGRMADEFSSFARMPAPVMGEADLSEVVRQAVFLQRVAHPTITFDLDMPEEPVITWCDARLVSQSLTNVLKNAVEAVETAHSTGASADQKGAPSGGKGHIRVRLAASGYHVLMEVIDNGLGLPKGNERLRLTEPYMTTRKKGTGLGLAIVRKVMEDHDGNLILDDAPEDLSAESAGQDAKTTRSEARRGAMIRLVLPQRGRELGAPQEADADLNSLEPEGARADRPTAAE